MGRPQKILVVDDERVSRRLLEGLLANLGYRAESAADGFEALEKIKSGFDLVLLDLVMPGMDGFEVIRMIRDDPEVSDIPIIMVTGRDDRETRLRAVQAGANDFISKPIDKLEVNVRVESLLKVKRAQDQIRRHEAELEDAVEKRTAELAESERRFRIVADFSRDCEYWQGTDGQLFYISPSCVTMTGYSPNEFKADPDLLNRIIHSADRARVMQHFEEAHGGVNEDQGSFNFRIVSKDERVFWVNHVCRSVVGQQGEWLGTRVSDRNVTSQKLLEEALFESQRRFVTLFEAAQDCMFIKDRELRYIEVNKAVEDFFGMPGSEFIGKTDEDLFRGEYHRHTADIESRVLLDQVIESQESLMWKSLRTNWSVIRFPLKEASGEVAGICGIAREMDDQASVAFDARVATDGGQYPSLAMRSTLAKAAIASETPATILLSGETGSGKDYLARYIHDRSSTLGPFLSLNCAAIPSELAESELFGHEAGAFTGAHRRKRGLVELAEGGTLLLNEIAELSLALQAKLLTFLDTFSFTRVGGEKLITVNVRLIAATSKELDKEMSEGRFRRDLFYRVNVFPIHVPALRERIPDIPLLAKKIVSELAHLRGLSPIPTIDATVLGMFGRYAWPGNLREMKNILERALILSKGGPIEVQHTSLSRTQATVPFNEISDEPLKGLLNEIVGKTERSLIEEALGSSNGNKQEAARILGISRFALARHMKKLGIDGR